MNAPDDKGRTPMFYVAMQGQKAAVEALRGLHSDVNIPDDNGVTPLMKAIMGGHTETAVYLATVCKAKTDAKSNTGTTAVHCAVRAGMHTILERLIRGGLTGHETGRNLANARESDGTTPMELAAGSRKIDVLRELIRLGANVSGPGKEKVPPLRTAIAAGWPEGVLSHSRIDSGGGRRTPSAARQAAAGEPLAESR